MSNAESPRSRALRVTGVTRSFAGVHALSGVSLAVEPAMILGLIGPNGAGKSTLVNIISGYDVPDEGSVEVDGRDITRAKPYIRAREGVARTFQHGHLFNGLTVRENIVVTAMGTGKSRRAAGELADVLLEDFGLSSRASAPRGHRRLTSRPTSPMSGRRSAPSSARLPSSGASTAWSIQPRSSIAARCSRRRRSSSTGT